MPETTKLSPAEEASFQAWAKTNKITDVDSPQSFYDYRGYWKDVANQGNDQRSGSHFPDTYKQHGHPTFSVESKYSKGVGDGGRWEGEKYIPAGADLLVNSRSKPKLGGTMIQSILNMLLGQNVRY